MTSISLPDDAIGPDTAAPPPRPRSASRRLLANGAVRIGGALLLAMLLLAVAAPWLHTIDPNAMDPASSRGLVVGMVAGYFRRLDGFIMRVMDGMMAIPGILFAIVLVAVWRPSLLTVILAIVVPETPRVARLVRSVVLSVREEPYVEAAVALDTPTWKLMLRHILPNTVAPLIVQGTFICAAAMLVEAVMSFLGIGLPSDVPTWGNIMSEGRTHFTSHPSTVLLPGAFLALTVLAVNMLGDGLRDALDPKFNQRGGRA